MDSLKDQTKKLIGINVDDEFNAYAIDLLNNVDVLLVWTSYL